MGALSPRHIEANHSHLEVLDCHVVCHSTKRLSQRSGVKQNRPGHMPSLNQFYDMVLHNNVIVLQRTMNIWKQSSLYSVKTSYRSILTLTVIIMLFMPLLTRNRIHIGHSRYSLCTVTEHRVSDFLSEKGLKVKHKIPTGVESLSWSRGLFVSSRGLLPRLW